jgi:saxitoxin biosynthesis operon SxtJ-like protein
MVLTPALILSIVAYLWTQVARCIYLLWIYGSYPIGWVVSHALMGLIYFLVLTPIGMIMKLSGRDPLDRNFQPEASSYWVPRSNNHDPSRYLRQF